MSDAENLFDDRDTTVWEAIGGAPDELVGDQSDESLTELLAIFRREIEAVREEHRRDKRELQRQIDELKNGNQPRVRESMCTLQKYAMMVDDGVGDSIGVNDRRAVAIYRNWDDLNQRLGNGQYGVTTKRNSHKKNQPNQFRLELEQVLGQDLEWEQVYRAMKAVAELSGGEPEHDQYGRLSIVGGIYEYHEKTTPDNTDSTVYKVLVET